MNYLSVHSDYIFAVLISDKKKQTTTTKQASCDSQIKDEHAEWDIVDLGSFCW